MGHWVMSVLPKKPGNCNKAPLFFLRLRRFRPGPPAFFQIHPAVRQKGTSSISNKRRWVSLPNGRECAGQPTGPVHHPVAGHAGVPAGIQRAPHHFGLPGIAQQAGNLPVSRYLARGNLLDQAIHLGIQRAAALVTQAKSPTHPRLFAFFCRKASPALAYPTLTTRRIWPLVWRICWSFFSSNQPNIQVASLGPGPGP